ncbi:MAG TPA: hypothetical protein VD999_02915 [Vitreimonas sp.]|nr:hypothetical protein [Vitreimonas sp.]
MLNILFDHLVKRDSSTQVELDRLNEVYPVRVILGLLEGYDKDEKVHTVEEVSTQLGHLVKVTSATVYTQGKNSFYTEPAALLQTDHEGLGAIYQQALAFNQERFTVENFAKGLSYVVETRHAKNPDK